MMNNNIPAHRDSEMYGLETEIFNTIVGFEENKKNETKKKNSERLYAARKAIEIHWENKTLASYLDDNYDR